MLEIHELRQLVAVADCGTLSAAAAQLHISQPVLSRSMRHMEDKLGLSLFTRSGGNHIALNEAGQLAVSEARSVLMIMEAMELRLSAFAASRFTVRIGSCVPQPLLSLLGRIAELSPQMTVTSELKEENAMREGLLHRDYDYVITQEAIDEKGFVSVLYDSEQLHVSVPIGHRLSEKDTVSLSELSGETMIVHERLGTWEEVRASLQDKVNFIPVRDNRGFLDLVHASSLPCFATNLTGSYSTPGNPRIEIPVSGASSIKDYYLSCAEKSREKLALLLPYGTDDP